MSESGDLVGMGAVAVLAILLWKKGESLFSGKGQESSSPAEKAERIVEVAGGTKETVREVIVQATGSGTESRKFDPWSWEGIFGKDFVNWLESQKKSDGSGSGGGGGGARSSTKATDFTKTSVGAFKGGNETMKSFFAGDTFTSSTGATIKYSPKSGTAGKASSTAKAKGTDVHGRSPAQEKYKKRK